MKNSFLLSLTWIVFAFLPFALNAQQSKEAKKIESTAKEYFRIDEFHQALPLYLKLDSMEAKNGEYNFRIGVCYLNSYDKTRALPFFERAVEYGFKDESLDMYLGRSYHISHYFDKASGYYSKFKAHLEANDPNSDMLPKINKYLQECEVGKELIQKPVDARIENLGPTINSIYPDYVPVISADEEVLIFTSRRPNSTGGQIEFETGYYYEDIYISEKKNKKWSKPVKMAYGINTDKHDASIGLSPDGQKLFVYRNNASASGFSGDIYSSNLKGNEWSAPERMPSPVNTDGWEPSASITPDENTIYFSSNREGGQGGVDIYMVRKLPSGEWAVPRNLGPNVNTEYDEDGPFIHPDGKTLYFSSRGHNTMGGYDIFKTVFNEQDETWSTPENLGYPINTADEDIYYVLSADGTRAYFSSHREDTYGDKDIYVAHLPVKSVAIIQFKGHVFRKDNNQPVAATITIADNSSKDIVGITNSNSFNGRFTTILPPRKNYNITVDLPGYLFYSENIDIPAQVDYFEVSREIYLEPIKGQEGSIATLRNIFFLPGEAELRVESEIELNNMYRKMMENPEMEVEIAAHTDNQNESIVNKLLSQARAQAVMDYLIDKGISQNRIFPVGYGDAFPIASNRTEEGRSKNRRVEVITIHGLTEGLLSDADQHGYYYRQGMTPFQEEEDTVKTDDKLAVKEGGDLTIKESGDLNSKGGAKSLPAGFKVGDALNDKMGITNIQFEFDSDKLRRDYYAVLDNVIEVMKKYPYMKIQVVGHTCNMGPDSYNQLLSERRVNSVVSYISYKGINAERFDRKGFGETKPKFDNSTREGRSKNRRVEFVITSDDYRK